MAAHSKKAIRAIEKEIIRSTIGQSPSPLLLFARETDFVIKIIRERTLINSIEKAVGQSEALVQQTFSDLLKKERADIFELTAEVRLEQISTEKISEIERLQLFSYFLTDFILYYPYAEDFAVVGCSKVMVSDTFRLFPLKFSAVYFALVDFQKKIKQEIVDLEKEIQEQILEEEWKRIPEKEQQRILIEEREKIVRNRILIEQENSMPEEVLKKMLKEEEEQMWIIERGLMSQEKQQNILKNELTDNLQQRILREEQKRRPKGTLEKMTQSQLKQLLRDKMPENLREQMLRQEWADIPEVKREQMLKETWKKRFVFEGELKRRVNKKQKEALEATWRDMLQEKREQILEEEWAKIPAAEREELLKEERNGRLEEERNGRLEKERSRRLEEERNRRLEEERNRRLEEEQSEQLEEEQSGQLEEEQSGQLEEEQNKTLRTELSLKVFNELLPEFQACLLAHNLNSSEEKPFDMQLIAVKTILDGFSERVAEKDAALKAPEKEEASEISEKKEDKVLSREENLEKIKIALMEACNMSAQDAESQALTILEKAEKEGTEAEKAEEEKAVNASIDSSSAAPLPPPPPRPLTERVAAGVRAFVRGQGGSREVRDENLEKIKRALMETCDMSAQDAESQARTILEKAEKERAEAERAVNASIDSSSATSSSLPLIEYIATGVRAFVQGKGGSEDAILKADALIREGSLMDSIMRKSSQLIKRSEVTKIPKAIRIPTFTKADKLEKAILHVLSVLPEGEELGSLETGYILVGREAAHASLYHVHRGRLAQCDPKDLNPLCGFVSGALAEDKMDKRLELSPDDYQQLIISQGGGHDYSKAEEEFEAKAETEALSSSISVACLSQSSASQKKRSLAGYDQKLLSKDQAWPEMAEETFYFKWDPESKMLTGQCKKADGTLFTYSLPYKGDATRADLSDAFKQSKLTAKVTPILQQFAKKAQPFYDEPPATSSDKKEEEEVAKDAMPPTVLAKRPSLQFGPPARSSFYAPPKESLFKGREIILLKDDQDWPKEMADKTLYFKWDEAKKMWDESKKVLAVKYKKEDSSISEHERSIHPTKVKLVSEAFKQPEGAILTPEVRNFLEFFAATPIVRPMSVVLPKKEEGVEKVGEEEKAKEEVKEDVKEEVKEDVKEEVKEDVKEEVKEDVKKEIAEIASEGSPSQKANRLSSSPSRFYSNAPLPPVPVITASDTNLPVTKSEMDSKLNSEKTSPSL